MGSGEGALSGDSYYGDGIYRSTDGGVTLDARVQPVHRAGRLRSSRSIPTNPNASLRSDVCGAAAAPGARRHRPKPPTACGSHRRRRALDPAQGHHRRIARRDRPGHGPAAAQGAVGLVLGRRDLPVDRRRQYLGQRAWATCPKGNFLEGGTRFSLGISHPAAAATATVYTGFDYFDSATSTTRARSTRPLTTALRGP